MESCNYRSRKPFRFALLFSILLHVVALSLRLSAPDLATRSNNSTHSRLDVVIAPPGNTTQQAKPSPRPADVRKMPADTSRKQRKTRILSVPNRELSARSWTHVERDEMEKFLSELKLSPPKTGFDLAQRALGIARQGGQHLQENDDEVPAEQLANDKAVEPFSLQMYFDAFIRKLNRSAAFVRNDPRGRGSHKALVQISLNPDGTLKSYRVLRAADQQAQIAYIKTVLDLAAPFSAFPPDIRDAMGSFSILICIFPAREGEGGGGFLRSFGGRDCDE